MKYIKKYYYIILFILFGFIRFLLSYKLPSFFIGNLKYDDRLIMNQLDSLINNNYLGSYNSFTLIKGIIFPLLIYYSRLIHVSYSSFLSVLYIVACIYFIVSLKSIIKDKKVLLIVFVILLFNPVTYSSELFQRIYITSISITELLFFLGTIILFVKSDKHVLLTSLGLGIISSIMLLTRNDNIWIYIVLLILSVYKISKNIKLKNIAICLLPFIIIVIGFNTMSFINYKHYNIYSYNEIDNSYFKKAYKKVSEIKTDDEYDNVTITKEAFYKLCDNSIVFNTTREQIDKYYKDASNTKDGEIDNGSIVWFFRIVTYENNQFKDGYEANEYYKELSDEIENLFENGVLERKQSISSVYFNVIKKNEIKEFVVSIIDAIKYTTTYKNVRTYNQSDLESIEGSIYSRKYNGYVFSYQDYRYSENVITNNDTKYEIIRIVYEVLTIVFSIVALIIYFKTIKEKDELNFIIHIIVLIYIIILSGVVYTHVTAFHAIRYRYLSNIYILQSLFILLNMYKVLCWKERKKNDISSNTSIQRRKIHRKNNKRNKESI